MSENNPDHAIKLLRPVFRALSEYLDSAIRDYAFNMTLFPPDIDKGEVEKHKKDLGTAVKSKQEKAKEALNEYEDFCYAHSLPEKYFKFPGGPIKDSEDMVKWMKRIIKVAPTRPVEEEQEGVPKGVEKQLLLFVQEDIKKDLAKQLDQFALEYRNSLNKKTKELSPAEEIEGGKHPETTPAIQGAEKDAKTNPMKKPGKELVVEAIKATGELIFNGELERFKVLDIRMLERLVQGCIEQPGRIVLKNQLMNHIWEDKPDSVYEDQLYIRKAKLEKALTKLKIPAKIITHHGKGYSLTLKKHLKFDIK